MPSPRLAREDDQQVDPVVESGSELADRLFDEPTTAAVDGYDAADPAASAWYAKVARVSARRAARRQIGLIVAGVLVVDLVLALVIPLLLPFLVVHRSSATTAAGPGARPPAVVAALPGSPADTVLTLVAADRALLPPGWARVAVAAVSYGSPYPRACPSALPPGTTGVGSRFVSGRTTGAAGAVAAPGGVRAGISVTALPAGQATLAVDRLRTWVRACPGADGVDPTVVDGPSVAPLAGADAFVARGGSGPVVTWVVWARGDLLVAASVTGLTSTSGAWSALASAVDAVVRRHLQPVCPELAPSAADATRNPALPGYRPFAPVQRIAVPPVDVVADPPAVDAPAVTLPDPVPHPDLAPVLVPDRVTWVDTNGDGIGDTPPPVASAPRGTVPVFRDPDSISLPDSLVTTAPVEPARPVAPPSSLTVPVPVVDSAGPGCGWGFTGGVAPRFDEASVVAAATQAKEGALNAAADTAATYASKMESWQPAEQAYLLDRASFTTWSRYDAALSQARQQLADAQAAHDASLVAYDDAVAASRPRPTTPPTSPTTSPTTTPTTPPSTTTTTTPPNPGG